MTVSTQLRPEPLDTGQTCGEGLNNSELVGVKLARKMRIVHTNYWERKRRFRPEITDDFIEYAIQNSDTMKDRNWEGLFNAIARVPSTGRKLKVVYRRKGKNNIDNFDYLS